MNESADRKHPLLFTPDEAAGYLHLDTPATLDTLERDHGLKAWKAGKSKLYWKKDLDACAYSIVGEPVPADLKRKVGLHLTRETA